MASAEPRDPSPQIADCDPAVDEMPGPRRLLKGQPAVLIPEYKFLWSVRSLHFAKPVDGNRV